MRYEKEIEIRYTPDVFVAGGGPAGVAAAVSAAEEGRSVFLAEGSGSFGGAGTTGLVPSFAQFTDGVNFLAGGFGRRVRDLLLPDVDIHTRFAPFQAEKLKQIYDHLVSSAGVDFSFFTRVIDAVRVGNKIDCVILSGKSGIYAVKAKIYIDCTGDGDLAFFSGARTEMGDASGQTMPATLCSLWSGIDYASVDAPQNAKLEEAFRDGVFTNEDRHLSGIQHTDRKHGIGGGNIGHCYGINGVDERSLTEGMITGRKIIREFERYYKSYLHGYENLYLCSTADTLGIRESRRVIGDYVLTMDDFLACRDFDDEIGRYCYPIDIHPASPDRESFEKFQKEYTSLRLPAGKSYGIPYRALTPVGMENLLVAGRCVSTDRQMQASIRVMPGCFITGQAAGIAAALACDSSNVRGFDVSRLRARIREKDGCKE